MANWHDEKEPAVYAPGERQRELAALSPKPPAASGDRYTEQAFKVWADLPGHRLLDTDVIAAALQAAAKEAQLRILEMYANAHSLDVDEYLAYIEKEGPL